MIAVLKPNATKEQREHLISWLERQELEVHISEGKDYTVLGLVGDTSKIDKELLQSLDIVSNVQVVSEPYKKCNRKFHPDDTVIDLGSVKIGGGNFCMIAGPCSVRRRSRSSTLPSGSRPPGPMCFGAARSSPAPRRMTSRA